MMLEREDLHDKLRIRCGELAFQSFGYQYIFDSRIKRLSTNLNLIKAMGLLVPALVGSIVFAYGNQSSLLSGIVKFATPVLIFQFVLSLLAVVYKWDDELYYGVEASASYANLHAEFRKIQQFPPSTYNDLSVQSQPLETEYGLRQQQDSKVSH